MQNRHTFATDLYRKTQDVIVVKNALGHSSVSNIQSYVHLDSSDVEKALSSFLNQILRTGLSEKIKKLPK